MPTSALQATTMQPGRYEILIKEKISEKWLPWFDEFTITINESGETLLTGLIRDQAALHGLLDRVRDLNLTLISVNRVKPPKERLDVIMRKNLFPNHPVASFFLVAFLITWALWIHAITTKSSGGIWIFAPDQFLGQLARWSPGIAAILVTLVLAGKQGLKSLFQPLGIWRVHIGWYALALLLQPALFFAGRLIDGWLSKSYQIASPFASFSYPLAFVIPVVIISAFPGSFAEELGWRGFALPRMQAKAGPLIASIVLALLWGAWHIPNMVYFGETQVLQFALAAFSFIPVTILYTWVYNNTKGSLLLVTLFHVGQQFSNNFLGILPTLTDDALMWLAAIVVLLTQGVKLQNREQK